MGTSYSDAGVDIDAGNRLVQMIKGLARSTFRPEVVTDLGAFGGLFALGSYVEPVLVSSVDGVGTKLKIAFALDKHDTVGMDLVNHCVNDILTCGAEPLFFLDYLATGRLVPEQVAEVVRGLAVACRESGCALIGGETAEMPGIYAPGEYDLAGFIVGVVERGHVLDGSHIQVGDVVLGLPSSGLHTNGYSLVRRVFGLTEVDRAGAARILNQHFDELGRTLGEELLEVHRCYAGALRPVLDRVKGLAHITGGGLVDNVPRILPPGVAVRLDTSRWIVPPIFRLVQKAGEVDPAEMYRVFNMGLGMVAVCSPDQVDGVLRLVSDAVFVGEVVPADHGPRVIFA